MGEIVNLRRARKARDRAVKAADADASRVLHGRSRAEREMAVAEQTLRERTLDGAKRED